MSTYAAVKIQGRDFGVTSDGYDKDGIRQAVKDYAKEFKGKVKPEMMGRVVVDAIASEAAGDFYAPFQIGTPEFAGYAWDVTIGPRGGVHIKGGRVKR